MNRFGTVTVEGGTHTLRFERLIRFSPEEIWAALTEPARLGEWLAEAEVVPGPNGSVSSTSARAGRRAVASRPGSRRSSSRTNGTSSARRRRTSASSSPRSTTAAQHA